MPLVSRSQVRVPIAYTLTKLLARAVSLLLSIIVLVFLIYIRARYKKNFPVAYTAIVYAICLDTANIISLSDRRRSIPQFSPLFLMILELGNLGLVAGGCVTLGYATLDELTHSKGYKYPADPWRNDALWMLVAVGIFHIYYVVLSCLDGWRDNPINYDE